MFKTIYTVRRKQGDSTLYDALFEDYGKAKAYAENEVAGIDDDFIYGKRYHNDGSFVESWTGDHNEVVLNDNAWLTDFRTNGIAFHNECGLVWEFENYEAFQKFIND